MNRLFPTEEDLALDLGAVVFFLCGDCETLTLTFVYEYWHVICKSRGPSTIRPSSTLASYSYIAKGDQTTWKKNKPKRNTRTAEDWPGRWRIYTHTLYIIKNRRINSPFLAKGFPIKYNKSVLFLSLSLSRMKFSLHVSVLLLRGPKSYTYIYIYVCIHTFPSGNFLAVYVGFQPQKKMQQTILCRNEMLSSNSQKSISA